MKSPLPPEKVELVVDYTRRGLSTMAIAQRVGCSDRTVTRIRKRAGIVQPHPQPLTTEECARADQLLTDGASYADVARTLGRDERAISNRFPGRGWTQQQRAEWRVLMRNIGREVLA